VIGLVLCSKIKFVLAPTALSLSSSCQAEGYVTYPLSCQLFSGPPKPRHHLAFAINEHQGRRGMKTEKGAFGKYVCTPSHSHSLILAYLAYQIKCD
jgi:hypothetical protein